MGKPTRSTRASLKLFTPMNHQPLTLKCRFTDSEELRRRTISISDGRLESAVLRATIAELFNVYPATSFRMCYRDDDDDLITLSTDEDAAECLQVALGVSTERPVIRLEIQLTEEQAHNQTTAPDNRPAPNNSVQTHILSNDSPQAEPLASPLASPQAKPLASPSLKAIVYQRDSDWIQATPTDDEPHAVVHLKGFASRVHLDDPQTAPLGKQLVDWFKTEKPAQLVWDGDDHAEDSFTGMIPKIYEAVGGIDLVAFLRECDTERFEKAWLPTGLPITVCLCADSLDWQKLGTHALYTTGAQSVLCWGGGGTVEAEFGSRPSADVKFTAFPVTRHTPDGAARESCSLFKMTLVGDAALGLVLLEAAHIIAEAEAGAARIAAEVEAARVEEEVEAEAVAARIAAEAEAARVAAEAEAEAEAARVEAEAARIAAARIEVEAARVVAEAACIAAEAEQLEAARVAAEAEVEAEAARVEAEAEAEAARVAAGAEVEAARVAAADAEVAPNCPPEWEPSVRTLKAMGFSSSVACEAVMNAGGDADAALEAALAYVPPPYPSIPPPPPPPPQSLEEDQAPCAMEEGWDYLLHELAEMGFHDADGNMRALVANQGEMTNVVAALVAEERKNLQ